MGGRSHVVVGVGLNIQAQPAAGLHTAPAALTERLPQTSAADALARVAQPLVQALLKFEANGFAPLQSRFELRDALKGRQVHTSDGQEGLALGVSASGGLRFQTTLGVQDIHSAEISVRPFI
jgi:BirA family biotin operon repressor/biotin-[acetyl-CoA-carboxylase] ligase